MAWLTVVKDAILDALSVLSIHLPDLVTRAAAFVTEQVWPLFWEALAQPIIWLAVAALVFGSQVLSLAELWRKGQPLLAKVPGSSRFASHAERRRARAVAPPPPAASGGRRSSSGRRSSATSTTSTCRPSTRCAWCCGPGSSSSAPTWPSTRRS